MRSNTKILLAILVVHLNSHFFSHAEENSSWFKGNTHTHSLWSDGNDFPEMIAKYYKDNGYHFLVLSDHNILSRGEKWMAIEGVEKRRRTLGVPTMKKYFMKVAELVKNNNYPKIYEILERVMLEKKNIHPNVDYPCGPTYSLMGIDTDFFTPIFVMARITGWSAHIMEQHTSNKLIRPLSKYKGQEVREVMLLNQR